MVAGDTGYVAYTGNGGSTWTAVNVFGANSSTYSIKFHSISMVSTKIAFVAGFSGSSCTIYKTIDGGISWFQVAAGFSSIYSLAMLNENLGVAGAIAGSGIYVSVAGNNIPKYIALSE